jgi:hypothetical protein
MSRSSQVPAWFQLDASTFSLSFPLFALLALPTTTAAATSPVLNAAAEVPEGALLVGTSLVEEAGVMVFGVMSPISALTSEAVEL